mmetsp:Transcript_60102/g.106772  ORF Transcript_60102/g.106772 Transcript_60102/m.106772 type:complete len:107 (-) Transcript_60102:1173-1493(-)
MLVRYSAVWGHELCPMAAMLQKMARLVLTVKAAVSSRVRQTSMRPGKSWGSQNENFLYLGFHSGPLHCWMRPGRLLRESSTPEFPGTTPLQSWSSSCVMVIGSRQW